MTRHSQGAALRHAGRFAFGAALAILFAVPAGAGWDGSQAIRPGDTLSAEFADTAAGAEVHRYSFYAPEGTTVSASVKAKGFSPKLGLEDFGQRLLSLGSAGTATKINKFKIAARGKFAYEMVSTSGTGAYTLKTSAVFPKSYKAVALATTLPSGVTTYTSTKYVFGAVAGSTITAAVKASKGVTAAPYITGLAGPDGTAFVLPDAAKVVKKVKLTKDGAYVLAIQNDAATPVTVDVTITVAAPKPRGRTFSFEFIDPARGTASEQRKDWLTSGHADLAGEAFAHWNNSTPAVIGSATTVNATDNCQRCHSGGGYEDFLGSDGSAVGTLEKSQPAGARTVDCQACHNPATAVLTQVTFPSGQTVKNLGDESRCMVCHQGRESTKSIETSITTVGAATQDTPTTALKFKNVHYFAAGATLYGREAEGAYEYEDPAHKDDVTGNPPVPVVDPVTGLTRRMPYDRKFSHVMDRDTCIGCHDPHTLARRMTECAKCHVKAGGTVAVATDEDLKDIRMAGTTEDYDGDGNITEGVFYELDTLSDKLYVAIKDYAKDPTLANQGLLYDGAAYPYFFKDVNANGVKDAEDTASFSAWTPRLLRAAYNMHYWKKDPGAYAHNAKYMVQILYDSIASLNAVKPVANFANLRRNDETHFNSSAEAYRDWDTAGLEGGTPASCSRCHSGEGFEFVVANPNEKNQQVTAPLTSGMTCESCHVDRANFSPLGGNKPERVYVSKVIFPFQDFSTSSTAALPSSGAQVTAVTITNAPNPTLVPTSAVKSDDSFICMTCHQGRQSKLTIDAYVATRTTPTLQQTMGFQNVHYLVAGGVQYSTKAAVAYQWTGIQDSTLTALPAGRTYQGPWTHDAEAAWKPFTAGATPDLNSGGMNDKAQCTFCHMQDGNHRFEVKGTTACTACHTGTIVATYRKGSGLTTDFDGDAATSNLEDEVTAFRTTLLKALNTYAVAKGKRMLAYDPSVNSYLFYDDNGDGIPDSTASTGRYAQLDKFMLFGAHDMHVSKKDPGSWAHNTRYILQVMYDSADYLDDELWNGSPVNATTGNPLIRPTTTY